MTVAVKVIFIFLIVGLVWLAGLYYLRNVWFYRDPVRVPPKELNAIVSPADGQVIYIKRIENGKIEPEKLGQRIDLSEISGIEGFERDGWLIGIYMSPLDVHFNYSPVDCEVEELVAKKAKLNLPMVDLWEYFRMVWLRRAVNLFSKKFHFVNERNVLLLDSNGRKIVVVEIADKFVNKINCFVEKGDWLIKGQKIGFIERGSQVDLAILDEELEILVKSGQQVYGSKTEVARYKKGL